MVWLSTATTVLPEQRKRIIKHNIAAHLATVSFSNMIKTDDKDNGDSIKFVSDAVVCVNSYNTINFNFMISFPFLYTEVC